ncbi:nitrile hydratase subunit beta [Streptomyces sp. NBC_00841]|uniref:hypothetical protein n=1 Tax=Streptomyces sp. NBC_00841 TaxID=2975847 RepID=UPI002DDA50A4|nr:hypothetical protein [Streptomyces sp. NBC_00841]WRZ98050.1 nitrile hydratase subunit beta [Streptomyces sp. NBC_00841]
MAFKVGDRVRVNDDVTELRGEVGTVRLVYPNDAFCGGGCSVVLDSDACTMHFYDTEISAVPGGDYEIRTQEPSDHAKSFGIDYPLYVVWDLKKDKRVPFGNYRRHDQAVARIIRMRDRGRA